MLIELYYNTFFLTTWDKMWEEKSIEKLKLKAENVANNTIHSEIATFGI